MTRLVLLVPVVACGGTQPADPAPPAPPVATRLEVWPSAVRLFALGDETLLTARILDRQGNVLEDEPVAWSTDDPSVAAVDGTGVVTAVANGSATVTAASGGLDGTAAVAVTQQATRVEVVPVPDTLRRYGDTVRVAVRAFDANGHPAPPSALDWTTSDSTVAVVDGTGLVTAVGNGSATISAGPGETAAVEVVVHDREGEDREVLLILYGDVSGPGWLTTWGFRRWDPSKSISTWWGVTTEEVGRATRVVELSLPDADLGGPLPRELGRLRSLRVLHLQGNPITSVPREVGMLPHLESLRLDHTLVEGIPGPFPSLKVLNLAETQIGPFFDAGHLTNLRSLDLSGNDLRFFPGHVFEMRDLEVLKLNGHWFTGQIPPELAELENLRVLGLAGSRNQPGMDGHDGMDSTIPPELGTLANLEELYLGGNRLRGTIPPELGTHLPV
ncbi:MAG: Ig-like domain-containing protein [Gammaproteobacteria bacterium]|nr:Ig-like domain-containing protein [Gammaproteobacteria bacterium]